MPGTNAGTGHPLWLRCAKCRIGGWPENRKGFDLEATGRTRERNRGGGARTAKRCIEYRCRTCGHVGWTIHIDGERLLRKLAEKEGMT